MPEHKLATETDAKRLAAEAELSAATVRPQAGVLGVVLLGVSLFFAGMSTGSRPLAFSAR